MMHYNNLGKLIREVNNGTFTDFIEKGFMGGLDSSDLPVTMEYIEPNIGVLSILISLIDIEVNHDLEIHECYRILRNKIVESVLRSLDLTNLVDEVRRGRICRYYNKKYDYTDDTIELVKKLKEGDWINSFYGLTRAVIISKFTSSFYKLLEDLIVYELYKIQSAPIGLIELFTDMMVKVIDSDSVYPSEVLENKVDRSKYAYYHSCQSIKEVDMVNECDLDSLSKVSNDLGFLMNRCRENNINLSEIIKMYCND